MNQLIECRDARLAIGGDPHHLSPEVERHVAGCAACTRFRTETLALDGRLRAALELPLQRFRKPANTRRYALAASLLLAVLVGGGIWLGAPQRALARDLVAHVSHEAGSWESLEPVAPDDVAALLAQAGVRYDPAMPVTYASPCMFRGRLSPHLVLQTDRGPVTVILLAHETVSRRREFSEGGYRGVLLPAKQGAVAVIARGDRDIDDYLPGALAGLR